MNETEEVVNNNFSVKNWLKQDFKLIEVVIIILICKFLDIYFNLDKKEYSFKLEKRNKKRKSCVGMLLLAPTPFALT